MKIGHFIIWLFIIGSPLSSFASIPGGPHLDAKENTEGNGLLDSLRTTDIEEIVVAATPKEQVRLRQQPLSSNALDQNEMQTRGIKGIKGLSAQVPNLFIPEYGSRLTTSIYIRGIGSRIGTPAIALYVDGVPQVSSAGYDMNMAGIDRIDVLRGPQNTLYGRGAMGGVIRVFTKNPFQYQGTEIDFDASHVAKGLFSDEGGRGRGRLTLTHYHRVSEKFAFTAHVFGDIDGGYFRNAGRNNELIDNEKDAGLRMRFMLKPQPTLDLSITASHEWLKQGGYPYEYQGVRGTPSTPEPTTQVGQIAYNSRSGYRRNLSNIGLTVDKRWEQVNITSVTGFQHLHDCMNLDQDFTTTDLYTLMQRQNINTLSEEVVVKRRRPSDTYDYLFGASMFQSWVQTKAPVTFREDGLKWLNNLVNKQGNAHLPTVVSRDETGAEEYKMNFIFDNLISGTELAFPGTYDTPSTNAALYHQSTFKNVLGLEGLTLTAGLRADYDYFQLDYDTYYTFVQRYGLGGKLTYPDGHVREGMVLVPSAEYTVEDHLKGELSKGYLQLLPKVTLLYNLSSHRTANIYANISRGCRAGGYNIQLFSDILQSRMQTAIMRNVANATVPVVDAVPMIPSDVKQTVRDMLINMGTQKSIDVQAETWYKPESSWNYEIGTHQTFWDGRIQLDGALFWMQTRNQQVSKMTEGGLGRITVNSGRSRSVGGELSMRAQWTDQLSSYLSYGFTHSKFIEGGDAGKTFVPFVPRNTVAAGITQRWPLQATWADALSLHLDYCGAGRIYWSEDNSAWQDFAGRLNFGIGLHKKGTELSLYARNVFSARYQTFYFETMQRGFAQYTRPAEIGIRLHWEL